ncbi:MAG: glycosyltransferase [Paludibacteraceae bacterium]|nr:glycosyltransferase [Paludibacteraceae bacterium]
MLNVSTELYRPDWTQVQRLVQTLLQAEEVKNIYLMDNSPEQAGEEIQSGLTSSRKTHYIWNNGKNTGFGCAHNIALRDSIWQRTRYHLVMDADVEVQAEDIDKLHHFMEHNPQVGLLMPKVVNPKGGLQYLCNLLPTPLDVFLPVSIGKKRRFRYELRATGYDRIMNVPNLHSCFMFLRTEAALQARLFDERYSTSFGHIDLTRTIHRNHLTLFVPDITIVKHNEKESHSQPHTIWHKIADRCRYFNKWGWLFDAERRETNRLTIQLCMTQDK